MTPDHISNRIMKHITFIIVLLGSVLFTTAQNIPSGDFESWSKRTKVTLDSFLTGGLVTRSSDAHSGSYAVRMENKRVEGDNDISSIVTNGFRPITEFPEDKHTMKHR